MKLDVKKYDRISLQTRDAGIKKQVCMKKSNLYNWQLHRVDKTTEMSCRYVSVRKVTQNDKCRQGQKSSCSPWE